MEERAMRRGTWICLSLGVALCGFLPVWAGDEPPEVAGRVTPASGAVGMPCKNALTARKVRLLRAVADAGAWQYRLVNETFVGGTAAPSRAAVLSRGNDGHAWRHWAFRPA